MTAPAICKFKIVNLKSKTHFGINIDNIPAHLKSQQLTLWFDILTLY